MITSEEKTRKKLLKKVAEFTILGSIFSVSFTLLDFLIFKSIYIFWGFWISLAMTGMTLLTYYLTFKKQIIPFKYAVMAYLVPTFCGMIALTYLAGGYKGSMISAYFILINVSALLFERKKAILVSIIVLTIYLTFFFGQTYKIIETPTLGDVNTTIEILDYSKAIIDMLAFIVVTLLITIISKITRDSINFYRLRSVRLSEIRKRLEFLVKRRTKELEKSNKELEQARNELRKSYKKLQKLDVKKDEFISIAAHELKTPLTAIGGYSQLLQNDKIIKNREKRKEFLKTLDKESKRLSNLVTEILNLSRIDLGVMKYYIEEVDLYELMKSIENEFSAKIKQKGLEYELKMDKDLKIKSDKGKLYEIITNLLTNAIKYTLKGKITVEMSKKGDFIEFKVADTGVGIAKKYHKKIFERFSPVDTSLRREVGGTGLGLSLCKEYVEKMNGKIWVKSKLGKGSTFFVKLPIEAEIKSEGTLRVR